MRKLYRGCAALAVAAGGFAYGTAEYTFRHPDSLVGRCVTAAYRMTSTFGPVVRTGSYLVGSAVNSTSAVDPDDAICAIPDEPEPVLMAGSEPCPAEDKIAPITAVFDPNRGRLPGKIVIDEGDEPPLADARVNPSYDMDRIASRLDGVQSGSVSEGPTPVQGLTGRAIEAVSKHFGGDAKVVQVSNISEARAMPYCRDDESEPRFMPRAEDGEDLEVKRPANPIWNAFMPKGTEVGGGEEAEPSRLGNDCCEDPTAPLQVPGCPHATGKKCPKPAEGGEEPSEMPLLEKKKGKRSEPEKVKKSFDDARHLPDIMRPKVDTMDFRPSDWGKDDVPLPPF